MGIGDIFKTGQFKNEIEELKQENARLQGELNHAQSLLTPEMQDAQKLHGLIDKLNSQKSSLESNIKDIEADISRRVSNIENLDNEIRNREKQIIVWTMKFLFKSLDCTVHIIALQMLLTIKINWLRYVQSKRLL